MKAKSLNVIILSMATLVVNTRICRADEKEEEAVKAIAKANGYVNKFQGKYDRLVILANTDMDAVLPQLRYLKDLETIQSHSGLAKIGDKHLAGFACVLGLKELKITERTLTNESIKSIARHKGLERLIIGGDAMTDDALGFLSDLKNLRDLTIGGPNMKGVGFRKFAKSGQLETLGPPLNITDEGMEEIASITSLKSLDLFKRASVSDQGLKGVANLVNLRFLQLSGTKVGDASMKEIAKLADLEFLSLEGTRLTDKGVKDLSGLKNLKNLVLRETNVTSEALASIGLMQKLENLGLSKTKIGDAGLGHLAKLPKLADLDLRNTDISDPGIVQLIGVKSLRRISLRGTQVTIKCRQFFTPTNPFVAFDFN